MNCPGSVELIDSLLETNTVPKETKSVYAEHGTFLHKVTDDYHKHGKSVLQGLELDDKALVQECISYLNILRKSKGHSSLFEKNEHIVKLDKWGIPDVWGTCDFTIVDMMKRHADVIDWKFGSGEIVYAEWNPQLLAYAAGTIGWPTTVQTVTLHIVQPAIDHFDTWDLTTNELYEWVHGKLAVAINKCATPGAQIIPGYKQCRWCEAANHCITRYNWVQDTAAKLFHAEKLLATAPDIKDLMELVSQGPAVEKAIKSIISYVQTEMEKGVSVPGYKLVRGRSNRKWLDEKKTIEWLSKNTNIEELFTSKLRSPSQFEKEVITLKKNEDYKKLFHNPPGKIAIAPETDKREAIEPNKSAVDVFKGVIE
jgi:hypothetical protein